MKLASLTSSLLLALLLACPIRVLSAQEDTSQAINALQRKVESLDREIARQQARLDAQSKPPDSLQAPIIAVIGVVVAAVIGGLIAIRNHNHQAAQERLLKAVEIIMESRSGYQADIRAKNLASFLDLETKKYMENISKTFSGPEYTDIQISLAQAMSDKASAPEEVLAIWKAIVKNKGGIAEATYP